MLRPCPALDPVLCRSHPAPLPAWLPACSTLYKLLRCTCLHCFKLRMAGGEVERFRRRLQLLSQGRLVEASNLVVGTSAAATTAGGDMIDDAMGVGMEDLDSGAGKQFSYDVAKGVKASVASSSKGECSAVHGSAECGNGVGSAGGRDGEQLCRSSQRVQGSQAGSWLLGPTMHWPRSPAFMCACRHGPAQPCRDDSSDPGGNDCHHL